MATSRAAVTRLRRTVALDVIDAAQRLVDEGRLIAERARERGEIAGPKLTDAWFHEAAELAELARELELIARRLTFGQQVQEPPAVEIAEPEHHGRYYPDPREFDASHEGYQRCEVRTKMGHRCANRALAELEGQKRCGVHLPRGFWPRPDQLVQAGDGSPT